MLRRGLLVIWLVVFLLHTNFAQLDTNKQDTSIIKTGIERIEALISMSSDMFHTNPAKSEELANQALNLSNQLNSRYNTACAYRIKGLLNYHSRIYDSAIVQLDSSARNYELAGDSLWQALTLKQLADIYFELEDYDLSTITKLEALSILEKLESPESKAYFFVNLSAIYTMRNETEKSVEYINKAIELFTELNNPQQIAALKNSLGQLYYKLQKFGTAIQLFQESNEIALALNNLRIRANNYHYLGRIAYDKGEYTESLELFQESLKLKNELELNTSETLCYIAGIYIDLSDFASAQNYFEIALGLAQQDKIYPDMLMAANGLIKIHETKRNYAEANSYLKLLKATNDSIREKEYRYQQWELRSKLESQSKSKETELLLKEAEINEVLLKKHEARTKFLIIFLTMTLVIFTLLIIYIFRNRNINHLLQQQKEKIDSHSKALEETNLKLTQKVRESERIKSDLIKGKAFLSGLIDSIPDLIFYKDFNSVYLGCNQSYARFYNIEKSSIVGMTDDELFSAEFASYFLEIDKKILENGTTWRKENLEVLKDGTIKVLDTYKTPIYTPEGEALGIMGISRDVTDIRKAKDEIIKLSQAVEQSPVVIMITNPEGMIEYINPSFTTLTGYKATDLLGSQLEILSPVGKNEELSKEIYRTINSGENWKGEFESEKKNGEKYWEIVTLSPIYDKSGKLNHILIIRENTTERKRKEVELLRAKQEALEASKAKSSFLANMSHEIRTPMNGIIGMTDFLKGTTLTSEQLNYVNIIDSSASNLLTIINDILDFSKIEAGKLQLENTEFSPKRVVEDLIGILSVKSKQRKIPVLKNFDKNLPSYVIGDPIRLRQVLLNLTDNALKFTHKGYVEVSVTLKSQTQNFVEVMFKVKDTGIGISDEGKKKLFKSFSQVDDSTTRKYGGTGLGLLISKLIVGLMNGKIEFESEPEKGSEFFFTALFKSIDDARLSQLVKQDEEKPELDKNISKLNILLVEDNLINQRVAQISLKRLNHHVDLAENGIEAIEKFKERSYDVILMDIQMPEMDGYEASRHIRKIEKENNIQKPTRIIAVTANAIKGDREKCFDAGMDDYISKPFKLEELKQALNF